MALGPSISISIFGDQQMQRTLYFVGEHGEDLRPVWAVIEEDIKQIGSAQFASQGARSSGGWTPLAPSTVEKKRTHGFRPEILRATDRLRDAVASGSDPAQEVIKAADWMVFRLTGELGEVGGYHQGGTSRMPMRKIIEFTEMDKERFIGHIQRYVMTGEVDWVN